MNEKKVYEVYYYHNTGQEDAGRRTECFTDTVQDGIKFIEQYAKILGFQHVEFIGDEEDGAEAYLSGSLNKRDLYLHVRRLLSAEEALELHRNWVLKYSG